MAFNYKKICEDLLKDLPQRQKEVISRRFALSSAGQAERETLELIGEKFGITRERVRQIEEDGFKKIKPKSEKYQALFQGFNQYLRDAGGLKKESVLLEKFGGEKHQSQIYFLLTIGDSFERAGESDDFHPLWLSDKNALNSARKSVDFLCSKLEVAGKPVTFNDLKCFSPIQENNLISYLEISKKIQKSKDGLFGLKEWPEINPRGIKDKAYLVFKKIRKPLHFGEVSGLIDGSLIQTVHNELIRDPRFVLVGRGIYALSEWGYEPGQVKDVILKVLKETRKPLTKEEILKRVLEQRMVKENTVFLNLSNKDYFFKNSQGKYTIKEA